MTEKSEKDMVIYLSGESQPAEPEPLPSFDELTPREIVLELDKYIVGQNAAKKAVADETEEGADRAFKKATAKQPAKGRTK